MKSTGLRIANSESKPTRPKPPVRSRRTNHDRHILLLALAGGLPAVFISLFFLWSGPYAPRVQWTLTVLIVCCWL
ncbi:MAG TPA: hypothetical protein VG778_02890, partial [Blastocatellia bacterium]|nr:hypothetical protein [Blastocatellia bacterium]